MAKVFAEEHLLRFCISVASPRNIGRLIMSQCPCQSGPNNGPVYRCSGNSRSSAICCTLKGIPIDGPIALARSAWPLSRPVRSGKGLPNAVGYLLMDNRTWSRQGLAPGDKLNG